MSNSNEINGHFDRVIHAWSKCNVEQPTPDEQVVLRQAFSGLFKKRGSGLRKSAEPWQGFMDKGTCNRKMLDQGLRNAFWYFVQAHRSPSSFMGTMFTLDTKISCVAPHYGFGKKDVKWDSPDYERNKKEKKRLFDLLDSMAIITILINGGKCSASDAWRKALGI